MPYRKPVRCPDESLLAGYVDGGLRRDERAAVDDHIDGCEPCRTIVSDLARIQYSVRDHGSRAKTDSTKSLRVHARAIHIVPGTMVGEYEVTGRIGAGGMGAVFAAIHPRIHKRVAIKVLRRDLARHASVLARFENEARAVNAIGHPNLVDIFAFGELPGGNPYFVMEHVEGESLNHWLKLRGAVPLNVALPIIRQIFEALAAAHACGIIHRDLKPDNIMIAEWPAGPRIKVLDFGLAKVSGQFDMELTTPGAMIGTPFYMSPEQYMGGAVDQRTDIYALGVLLYQMLCGQCPISSRPPTEIGIHCAERSEIMARLPPSVDALISKALAKDPADRFATVLEFRDALEQCVSALAPVAAPVVHPPRSRWRRVMIAAAVTAVTSVGISLWLGTRPVVRSPERLTLPMVAPAAAVLEPETAVVQESAPTARAPTPSRPKARKRSAELLRKPPKTTAVAPILPPGDDDRMLLEAGTLDQVRK